jgi:uncharacterized protein
MKKVYYYSVVPINENIYLYYNAFKNNFLIMNAKKHFIFQDNLPNKISEIDSDLYAVLIEGSFIIEDSVDETAIVEYHKLLKKTDTNQYHIVINTTLDCNLNCWYCYESKIVGSRLTEKTIEVIKKNINQKYDETPYKELKISFFGGEPLMNFDAIQNILSYCKDFTTQRKIRLIADFTTNATLLTKRQLLFLQDYICYFQITLDGYENKHNKIRFLKENKEKTYRTVVNNIYKIQSHIKDSKIWVRINFDSNTLENFPEILDDLSDLNRKKTFLIIRKIWQYSIEKINNELILKSIQLAIDKKFHIDNYAIPRYDPCFADRLNQVLINYDGKIFKCSTIEHFDDTNSEGTICEETGKINWDINKLAKKFTVGTPEKCHKCKIFPVCLGPCGKNTHGNNFSCMYEHAGFNINEYIMYAYKLSNLESELFP